MTPTTVVVTPMTCAIVTRAERSKTAANARVTSGRRCRHRHAPAGNVEAGILVLDPRACCLPAPPRVELALYRRPALRNDPVSDFLENLLWKAAG
jgi:hypothetical protein